MIEHDHIEPDVARCVQRRLRSRPAIYGDKQVRALVFQICIARGDGP